MESCLITFKKKNTEADTMGAEAEVFRKKKVFLKISQPTQENTFVGVFF